LEAKLNKKFDAWICDSASSRARLTLLDSCVSGIPSYYLAMFLLNKTFIGKLDQHRRRFVGLVKQRETNSCVIFFSLLGLLKWFGFFGFASWELILVLGRFGRVMLGFLNSYREKRNFIPSLEQLHARNKVTFEN
jgi:hypothetical protein